MRCRAAVETFLDTYDFGARTLYPFVLGTGNDEASLLAALSQHQPGALLGEPALLFTPETEEAGPSPSGPSPCPCAMGSLPRKGVQGTPWPPPR